MTKRELIKLKTIQVKELLEDVDIAFHNKTVLNDLQDEIDHLLFQDTKDMDEPYIF